MTTEGKGEGAPRPKRIKCDGCGNPRIFPHDFYTYLGRMTTRSLAPDGTTSCKSCVRGESAVVDMRPTVESMRYVQSELRNKTTALANARRVESQTNTRCMLLETAVGAMFTCGDCKGYSVIIRDQKVFECSCRRMLREVLRKHFPHVIGG